MWKSTILHLAAVRYGLCRLRVRPLCSERLLLGETQGTVSQRRPRLKDEERPRGLAAHFNIVQDTLNWTDCSVGGS